ncbi:MAG: universal stress protein [Phycisphaerales bacterium]|nr:universal stress protein [Phycisphaerales bacterium]
MPFSSRRSNVPPRASNVPILIKPGNLRTSDAIQAWVHRKLASTSGRCVPSEWRGRGYGLAIVRFVKEQGCDLALPGTRDRWNARAMTFGSTAERVVREARCPILAAKPGLGD